MNGTPAELFSLFAFSKLKNWRIKENIESSKIILIFSSKNIRAEKEKLFIYLLTKYRKRVRARAGLPEESAMIHISGHINSPS